MKKVGILAGILSLVLVSCSDKGATGDQLGSGGSKTKNKSAVIFAKVSMPTMDVILKDLLSPRTEEEYEKYFEMMYEKHFSKSEKTLKFKEKIKVFFKQAQTVFGQVDQVIKLSDARPVDSYFVTFEGTNYVFPLDVVRDKEDKIEGVNVQKVMRFNGKISHHRVEMRDGKKLETYVFTNETAERRPVILRRSPYVHRDTFLTTQYMIEEASLYLKEGYNLVVQAIRGTYSSEGTFRWLSPQEIDDAQDLVSWVEKQSFAEKKIMPIGTSYDGFTALAAGVDASDSVKAVVGVSAPTNVLTDSFTRGGVTNLSLLNYIHTLSNHMSLYSQEAFKSKAVHIAASLNMPFYDTMLTGIDYAEWNQIANDYGDLNADFWSKRGIQDRLKDINVPTYHVAGMMKDQDGLDSVRNFIVATNTKNEKSSYHKLYLGNWGHGGLRSGPMKKRLPHIINYHLKGTPTDYVKEARVQMSSHYQTELLEGDVFPIPGAQERKKFYFGTVADAGLLLPQNTSETPGSFYSFNVNPVSGEGDSIIFGQTLTENMAILGSFEFDLNLEIDTYQTDIYIDVIKKVGDKYETLFENNYLAKRLVRTEGSSIINVKFKTPPIFKKLKKGDVILYRIKSRREDAIFIVNRNNSTTNYNSVFTDGSITLIHSKGLASSVTIPVEASETRIDKMKKAIPGGETSLQELQFQAKKLTGLKETLRVAESEGLFVGEGREIIFYNEFEAKESKVFSRAVDAETLKGFIFN